MYVNRHTEACSCNHCRSGKEINLTYSECVSVFLIIFSAVYIAVSGLSGFNIFSTLFHKRHDFRGGECNSLKLKRVFCFSLQFIEPKKRVLFFPTIY